MPFRVYDITAWVVYYRDNKHLCLSCPILPCQNTDKFGNSFDNSSNLKFLHNFNQLFNLLKFRLIMIGVKTIYFILLWKFGLCLRRVLFTGILGFWFKTELKVESYLLLDCFLLHLFFFTYSLASFLP